MSSSLPDIPVLWFHLCDPRVLPPPRFSRRQLTAGPYMAYEERDGTPISIPSPRGSYDLAEVLAPVRGKFEPELVLVYADAGCANLPRNLAAVPGVKVLVLGDTHHLPTPLQLILKYARSEKFDWIVSPHNRHHLHFFVEAGFPNVAWLPNLECDVDAALLAPRERRRRTAIGSGQMGAMHPARVRLVSALQKADVPYEHCVGRRDQLSVAYAAARVVLNRSLNGDLNLRVSEVLAASGCLVTDALSPQSGLDLLLEPGREIVTYADDDDAVEVVRALLDDPTRAEAIATSGWNKLRSELCFPAMRRRLFDLVLRGEVEEPFSLARDLRCSIPPSAALPVSARLPLYEHCQEQNRRQARGVLGLASDVEVMTVLDLIDLHRTQVVLEDGATATALRRLARFDEIAPQIQILPAAEFVRRRYDLLVPGAATATRQMEQPPAATWMTTGAASEPRRAYPAEMRGAPADTDASGRLPVEPGDAGATSLSLPAILELMSSLDGAGQGAKAAELCRQVLEQLAPAHEALALLELRRGNATDAAKLLGSAVAIAPNALSYRLHATKALIAEGRYHEARVHAERAVELAPDSPIACDAVAAAAYASDRYADAERALRAGLELDDGDARRWSNLATLLDGQGDLVGAALALERAVAVGATPWLEERLRACRASLAASSPKSEVQALTV